MFSVFTRVDIVHLFFVYYVSFLLKDITTRVIASEVNIQETPVSTIMTKHPVFVLSDTLAVEALQKMVLGLSIRNNIMYWFLQHYVTSHPEYGWLLTAGKFRHLPVVENGEVIALLDIAKCLYDAIARLERAAEKGKAIVAAVEGVEKNWGASVSGWCWTFCVVTDIV